MYEMGNIENRMHSFELAIIYKMAAPIDMNINAFNKDTAAMSLERAISTQFQCK